MKYARQCSVTTKGMNNGWVWGDGAFYTATLEDTLNECRKDRESIVSAVLNDGLGCELHELDTVQSKDDITELENAVKRAKKGMETDEDLLLIGYHTDYLYYTEWECEEDMQYEELNGILNEIK